MSNDYRLYATIDGTFWNYNYSFYFKCLLIFILFRFGVLLLLRNIQLKLYILIDNNYQQYNKILKHCLFKVEATSKKNMLSYPVYGKVDDFGCWTPCEPVWVKYVSFLNNCFFRRFSYLNNKTNIYESTIITIKLKLRRECYGMNMARLITTLNKLTRPAFR